MGQARWALPAEQLPKVEKPLLLVEQLVAFAIVALVLVMQPKLAVRVSVVERTTSGIQRDS